MNAPHLDIKYIHSHPFGSVAWMEAIRAEEKRCCGQIDARIKTLQVEEQEWYGKYFAVEKQLETEAGFFARLKLTLKLSQIDRELKWRQSAILELLDARIARTYA